MYWNIGPDSGQGTWAPNFRKTHWGSILQVGLSQFDKSWVKRDFLSQINVGNCGSRKMQGFLLKDFWDFNLLITHEGFPHISVGKESACNAGDPSSIPGSGRSPGEGKGYPLQYSGLENSMDCIVHGVTKSQTQLSNFHFHTTGLLTVADRKSLY